MGDAEECRPLAPDPRRIQASARGGWFQSRPLLGVHLGTGSRPRHHRARGSGEPAASRRVQRRHRAHVEGGGSRPGRRGAYQGSDAGPSGRPRPHARPDARCHRRIDLGDDADGPDGARDESSLRHRARPTDDPEVRSRVRHGAERRDPHRGRVRGDRLRQAGRRITRLGPRRADLGGGTLARGARPSRRRRRRHLPMGAEPSSASVELAGVRRHHLRRPVDRGHRPSGMVLQHQYDVR